MSTKVLVRIIIGAIIVGLLVIIYLYQSDTLQGNNLDLSNSPVAQGEQRMEEPTEQPISVDRVKSIVEDIKALEEAVSDQKKLIDTLSENNDVAVSTSDSNSGQKVLSTAQVKGPSFSTGATTYAAMNTFVNIVCSAKCILWVDFYTTSKNDTASNVNTYGIFLNGGDQSISSYATMPIANGVVPISLSGAIPTSAGTHTVEIRAKTSGGTLQTDTSFLKVLAIERL